MLIEIKYQDREHIIRNKFYLPYITCLNCEVLAATVLVALVTKVDLLAILMAISPVVYSQACALTK